MHELSVAMSIVELVEERAQAEKGERVTSVELEIGAMAGIVREALEFAWEPATNKTMLEGSELKISWIETESKCLDCNHLYHPDSSFDPCPKCGSYRSEILKGRELRVSAFFLE